MNRSSASYHVPFVAPPPAARVIAPQRRHAQLSMRRLRQMLRFLALGIAALHTWVAVGRQSMSEDGINYLDMGDAYLAGNWTAALSTVWSPLYSIILGTVQRIVQPSIRWEFPLVQMTNFVLFVVALCCFEFFWRRLPTGGRGEPAGTLARFAPRAWLALGYALFIWSSLSLVTVWAVTPDMLVAALVYIAGGLLLQLRDGLQPRRTATFLGIVLGVAYLAKAAMFPLALALILVAAVINRGPGAVRRLAWTLIPFVIVSGPLVVATSAASGHLTFGDVGRFTYMKHVNGLAYPHWGGTLERVTGTPEHPPQLLLEQPPVYAFAHPGEATYPLGFDPGYWTRGLSPRIDPSQQFDALARNAAFYVELFTRQQGGFVAVALLLSIVAWRTGRRPPLRSAAAALVAWAVCAFGLYAVVYAEPRYVGPFVVLFWAGALAWLRFPAGPLQRQLAGTATITLALLVGLNVAAFNLEGAWALSGTEVPPDATRPARFSDGPSDNHPAIADGLLRLGIKRGDAVGFVGDSFAAYWARLARLRIVAEIPPADAEHFWRWDADARIAALQAFARAGAVAVIAARAHAPSDHLGWHNIGETGYAMYLLR